MYIPIFILPTRTYLQSEYARGLGEGWTTDGRRFIYRPPKQLEKTRRASDEGCLRFNFILTVISQRLTKLERSNYF